jgi:hypothetical protein
MRRLLENLLLGWRSCLETECRYGLIAVFCFAMLGVETAVKTYHTAEPRNYAALIYTDIVLWLLTVCQGYRNYYQDRGNAVASKRVFTLGLLLTISVAVVVIYLTNPLSEWQ